MISEKAVRVLKSLVLPLLLYLILFNPFFSEQDQHIKITMSSAFLSLGIALSQLALFIFMMAKVNRLPLADTGLFSFSYKTMLKLIPSMLIIWGIYFAGILMLLLTTGSAEDPAIITLELKAPLWMLALMMLGVGYCEEFFFRVYLVDTLKTVLGKKAAIIISAVFFALGHMYQGYLAVIIIFFIALGFQWIYCRYKSIHVNAVTHAMFDVISVLLKGC
ncbi:MAG: CPBP family intramembrane metalloprotease [Spirochaetia bacterium]|jgi:membrane protease YdiL (CAAX protease family)|nr:CPBP family intramembrane metalloprotease [Spirochaetia bacterium]